MIQAGCNRKPHGDHAGLSYVSQDVLPKLIDTIWAKKDGCTCKILILCISAKKKTPFDTYEMLIILRQIRVGTREDKHVMKPLLKRSENAEQQSQ